MLGLRIGTMGTRSLVGAAALLLVLSGAAAQDLRTLIVGGGPEPQHNQVAIERNVYYVSHLLPAAAPRWILFAGGDPAARNVVYEESPPRPATGEPLFALLFARDDEGNPAGERH